SRRRHTRCLSDWSSDVCSSDLNRVVQMSRADLRLVAGALVGSTAGGGGDKWSDLDLTFGLADGAGIDEVLADWTDRFANEFQARSEERREGKRCRSQCVADDIE